jgi:polar amino acid transport system substrate-binding protein
VQQFVADHPEFRLIEEPFMQIRQAVGTTTTRRLETIEWLTATVEELKTHGFIGDALRRSGQSDVAVAPQA